MLADDVTDDVAGLRADCESYNLADDVTDVATDQTASATTA